MEKFGVKKVRIIMNPLDNIPEFVSYDNIILPYSEGLLSSLEYLGYIIETPQQQEAETIDSEEF
jgi:hypothetical protein